MQSRPSVPRSSRVWPSGAYLTNAASLDEIVSAFDHDGSPAKDPPPTSIPSLDRVEWEHVGRVLCAAGGNVSQAAALLGLHRRSLQRKLAKGQKDR